MFCSFPWWDTNISWFEKKKIFSDNIYIFSLIFRDILCKVITIHLCINYDDSLTINFDFFPICDMFYMDLNFFLKSKLSVYFLSQLCQIQRKEFCSNLLSSTVMVKNKTIKWSNKWDNVDCNICAIISIKRRKFVCFL